MDATHRTLSGTPRRLATTFVCLIAAGVLAGGAGGYLVRGITTSPQSVSAPTVVAPASVTYRAVNGDSVSGYETRISQGASPHALNGDSVSGYRITSMGALSHALNGDSTSGYKSSAPVGALSQALNGDSKSGY